MTIEIALALLAAAIPMSALVLKFSWSISPVQFVKLETEFHLFQQEILRTLSDIKRHMERQSDDYERKNT